MQGLRKTFWLLITLVLTACGGGGGGGGGDSGSNKSAAPAYNCPVDASAGSFTISGSVNVLQGSMVDSDTLLENSTVVDNGSFLDAQNIPAPVTIGGFLTTDSQQVFPDGSKGDDLNDYYKVELKAGDLIQLQVGDIYQQYVQYGFYVYLVSYYYDLDLKLYDAGENLLAASTNDNRYLGPLEVLEAPADGEYFIEVNAFGRPDCGGCTDSSGYVLTIARGLQTSAVVTNSLADEFVPGEVLVQYREAEENLDAGVPVARAASVDPDGLEVISGERTRVMRMSLPLVARASAAPTADAQNRQKLDTLLMAKRLRGREDIEFASLNYIFNATAVTPNDEDYSEQWHYDLINLPDAWGVTTGNPDVVVAVIDTGIKNNHPDLKNKSGLTNKLVDGFDFVGIDTNPFDPTTGISHGTHVAGTIAARTDNTEGGAGVGWDVSIMALRALGVNGSGTFYDITQAMYYAAGLPNDSNIVPSKPANVINMSLGGPASSQGGLEQSVIDQVRSQGVIIVASAGNSNSSYEFYPASFNGVVSVSAVAPPEPAQPLRRAYYSSFGSTIDVAAPGGEFPKYPDPFDETLGVYSTATDYDYAYLQGTSMAAPHVSGVIALMQSARLNLGEDLITPTQFDQLLQSGALTQDIGSAGRDNNFGYGLIDAKQAVDEAVIFTGSALPAELGVWPGTLDFRADLTSLSFTLSNLGDGSIAVDAVSKVNNSSWLQVTPPAEDMGRYQVVINRSSPDLLTDGDYSDSIKIDYTDDKGVSDSIAVDVFVNVDSTITNGQVGDLQVKLYRPGPVLVTSVDPITVLSGSGTYEFTGIDAGCYLVATGTDIDANSLISDTGEAWGVYGTKTDFAVIELDQDATDIDLQVSFDQVEVLPTGASSPEQSESLTPLF